MIVRVFEPVPAEGYEWIQPVDRRDHENLYRLDGTPRADGWKPVRVRLLEADEDGRVRHRAEMPWLQNDALVFRDRALDVVRGTIGDYGEFLPLDVIDRHERLWLFNATCVIDALDEDASQLVRFSGSTRILTIERPAFRPDRLIGCGVFKIPQDWGLDLSDAIVRSILSARLTGTSFEPVWEGTT